MGGTAPEVEGPRHVPELDGLRGVAIALVLAYHSLPWVNTTSVPAKVLFFTTSAGWVGVDLFFVLSGYLITGILLDGEGQPRQLAAFYARRALRILPAYYTLLGVLLALYVAGRSAGYPGVPAVLTACALFVSNFVFAFSPAGVWPPLGVTWSLAVEEQFYLIWPWVVRWAGRIRLERLCLVVFVAVAAIRMSLVAAGVRSWDALHYLTVFKFDALCAGGFLAGASRKAPARLREALPVVGTVTGVGLALLFATNNLNRSSPLLHSVGFPVMDVAFASFVGWCSRPGAGALGSVLRARPLRYLGRISYGLYLWHQVPNWIFEDYVLPRWSVATGIGGSLCRGVFVLASSLLLAEVSWRIIESPLLRMRPAYPRVQ